MERVSQGFDRLTAKPSPEMTAQNPHLAFTQVLQAFAIDSMKSVDLDKAWSLYSVAARLGCLTRDQIIELGRSLNAASFARTKQSADPSASLSLGSLHARLSALEALHPEMALSASKEEKKSAPDATPGSQ